MPTKFDVPFQTIGDYGEQVIAPILLDYVEWVLEQAKQRNLKRLYFLARDGYILRKLAELLCKTKALAIECRYLYCSRYALRCASYGLLSQDEVISMVGISSVQCSPLLILKRCPFTVQEIEQVAAACRVTDLQQLLDDRGRLAFSAQLKECSLFWRLLQQESHKAYEAAVNYFRQEGLLEGNVAIVDSGWSGSIQRSLSQLLRSEGFTGQLRGFYFGMYQSPKRPEDGLYHTFYFNRSGKLSDKAWFNNNLFECMLAAPHGMTVGYTVREGYMVPQFQEKRTPMELKLVREQEAGILRYAQHYLQGRYTNRSHQERLTQCRKNLRRCMVHPTLREVELLSAFQFCDDSTEEYFMPLAEVGTLQRLNSRLLPVRALRKLTHGSLCGKCHPFIWYYGAVVGAPPLLRPLYRWNEFLWECVRLSR